MLRTIFSPPSSFQQKRYFSTSKILRNSLVICDHNNQSIYPSTLNTISCAKALGKPVDLLVLGKECSSVVSDGSLIEGIRKVFFGEHKDFVHPTAEFQTSSIQSFLQNHSYTHILSPATSNGKNIIPRLAALLDVQPISEVQAVLSEDTFVRPIYAGNALQTVKSEDRVKVFTVRTTSFPAAAKSSMSAPVTKIEIPEFPNSGTEFIQKQSRRSERPELTSADKVISGGRALKSAENFQILFKLADAINAAVGASRAAVDAGYAPNDMQVGQTGKVVAPTLYLAVGISGAIQHLAGMKDSKVIVAINNDAEAPIFQVADYGLVGDLFKVVPELTEYLEKLKK